MHYFVRTAALAALTAVAAGTLVGCVAQPYGYGSYPASYPQPVYAQPVYPQPVYPQPVYQQAAPPPAPAAYPPPPPRSAPPAYQQARNPAEPAGNAAVYFGTVESIETLATPAPSTSGAGTVVGGLVGGLLGHQIGGGRGNTVATIGGAVAGAVAGNEVEKRSATGAPAYRVRVRTSDNGLLTVTQTSVGNLRNGDRVRVENGVAMPSY